MVILVTCFHWVLRSSMPVPTKATKGVIATPFIGEARDVAQAGL